MKIKTIKDETGNEFHIEDISIIGKFKMIDFLLKSIRDDTDNKYELENKS